MATLNLPAPVLSVLAAYRVCEFTTLTRTGRPITTPLPALFEAEYPRFVMTTSIGIPLKALRARRNPRVSLLYSDSTGSGVAGGPAVLVQGEAQVSAEVVTSMKGLERYWRDIIFARQPFGKVYHRTAIGRWLLDWYYMRLVITVRPRRFLWWEAADFNRPAHELRLDDVV